MAAGITSGGHRRHQIPGVNTSTLFTKPAEITGTTKNLQPARLEDPKTKYPAPPYPEQLQSWPGLVSKMTPVPDHGENSYRGSGRLIGRKAWITGGDSGMGRAAAIAYAREGADVAINYLQTRSPTDAMLLT